MRPLRLTMQAFGSYGKKTEIDFTKTTQNLFLVTGDTGAGKTTIFDAIVFALYGEASSTANKKDGTILQSQYSEINLEPYVELCFEEEEGGERKEYTVRRVPRHLRTVTRGAAKGVGTREINGSISLMMPDGTEYPSKEADKKIEELVGLTKQQFMQVAMIAQGEFMELLRAKSDDKKVIFRKLFNTQLYQRISEELGERKKTAEKELEKVRTECRTLVSGLELPNEGEIRENGSVAEKIFLAEEGKAAPVTEKDGVSEREESAVAEKSAESREEKKAFWEEADLPLLQKLQSQIRDGKTAPIEEFYEGLTVLSDNLQKHCEQREEELKEAERQRDQAMAALTKGESLKKAYEQLKEAEALLEECRKEEPGIQEMEELGGKLKQAYELENSFRLVTAARKTRQELLEGLKKEEEKLPELTEAEKEAGIREQSAKKEADEKLAHFSQMKEKATNAEKLFDKQKELISKERKATKALAEAKALEEEKRQTLGHLEEQDKADQNRLQSLDGVTEKLVLKQEERKRILELQNTQKELCKKKKKAEAQEKKAEKARKAYRTGREEYTAFQSAYEEARQHFLDAQAGFLAAGLEAGKPCPVCGSLEHPSPCKSPWQTESLNREGLETMSDTLEQLRKAQELQAAAAGEEKARFEQEVQKLAEETVKLWKVLEEAGYPDEEGESATGKIALQAISENVDERENGWQGAARQGESSNFSGNVDENEEVLEDIAEQVDSLIFSGNVDEREAGKQETVSHAISLVLEVLGRRITALSARVMEEEQGLLALSREEKELREAGKLLQERQKDCRKEIEAAAAAVSRQESTLAGVQEQRKLTEQQIEETGFASGEEVEERLNRAEEGKDASRAAYERASKVAKTLGERQKQCQALIERYRGELPEKEEELEAKLQAYGQQLKEKGISEEEWMLLTRTYDREAAERIAGRIQAFREKRAGAESQKKTSLTGIQNEKEPDMESLKESASKTEDWQRKARETAEKYRDWKQEVSKVQKGLAERITQNKKRMEEYDRLDNLYRLVSGNVTGARMDLETYVQRFYLEQILDAANRRFLEMSAGQFELRMYDLEKAGEGRNKGLDLMVYSTVTGKVREIRTLSGGESFMAALSLALGMADQIQESSAAIHLEIMFIDEGFGSLDEHSRQQAVRVLQEMAAGNRLTGIISHVTELKQEIDDQLIVTKDDEGSHVRWQLS